MTKSLNVELSVVGFLIFVCSLILGFSLLAMPETASADEWAEFFDDDEIMLDEEDEPKIVKSKRVAKANVTKRSRLKKIKHKKVVRKPDSDNGISIEISDTLKINGGLVTVERAPYSVGLDYTLPMNKLIKKIKNPKVFAIAGVHRWSSDSESLVTVEAGADYQYYSKNGLRVFLGVRLSYSALSSQFDTDDPNNESINYFSPTVSIEKDLKEKGTSVGAEFKKPMTEKVDGNYLLGYYRFEF